MADPEALYQDIILDHFKHPRQRRALAPDEPRAEGVNPACGDRLALAARLESGRLRDLHFEAAGCALSIASASLMVTACEGLSPSEIRILSARVCAELGDQPSLEPLPGDLQALTSVRRFPMRRKCALLSWRALGDWLDRYASAPLA